MEPLFIEKPMCENFVIKCWGSWWEDKSGWVIVVRYHYPGMILVDGRFENDGLRNLSRGTYE